MLQLNDRSQLVVDPGWFMVMRGKIWLIRFQRGRTEEKGEGERKRWGFGERELGIEKREREVGI